MSSHSTISCFTCGYSIAELPEDANCPECGYPCIDTAAMQADFDRTFASPRLSSSLFIALCVFELLAAAWLALPAIQVLGLRIFQTNLLWAPGLKPRIFSALIVGCIITAGVHAVWTLIAESVRLPRSRLRRLAIPAASIPGVLLCIWTAWTVLFDELSLIVLPISLLFVLSFVVAPIAQVLFVVPLTDTLPFAARSRVQSWNHASLVLSLATVVTTCFLAILLLSYQTLPPAAIVIFFPLAPAAGCVRSWLLARRIRSVIGTG